MKLLLSLIFSLTSGVLIANATPTATGNTSNKAINKIPLNTENKLHDLTTPTWLKPYSAQYKVTRGGDKKGVASRVLSVQNNIWKLISYSKVSIFLFSDKRTEVTTFKWLDHHLKTLSYLYEIKNSFSKKKTREFFDWDLKIIRGSRDKKGSWQLPLEEDIYNSLSHQIVIRQFLISHQAKNHTNNTAKTPTTISFKISAKGHIKSREYQILNSDTVQTPAGEFNAIKIVRQSGSRKTIFWMAPKFNYIPIKIYQEKKGAEQGTMVLTNINFSKN